MPLTPPPSALRLLIASTLMGVMLTAPLIMSAAGAAPDTSSSNTAKDRAKWRLATLAAARQILDELNTDAPFTKEERLALVEALNETMRQNPAAHARREDSRKTCADLASRIHREAIDRRIQDAVRHAGEQSPLPVTPNDVLPLLDQRAARKLQQGLDRGIADSLFTDARARALGLLRQEIERKLRFPTEPELNSLLTDIIGHHATDPHLLETDEAPLQSGVVALAMTGQAPVFEELRDSVTGGTRQIVQAIRTQYDRQLAQCQTAADRVPPTQRRQSIIHQTLSGELDAYLKHEQVTPPARDPQGKPIPIYGIFSPILAHLPVLAGRMEETRFRSFLETSPLLALDAKDLEKRIRTAPEKHVTAAASKQAFSETMGPLLTSKTLADYSAQATPPASMDYFSALVSNRPPLATTLRNRLDSELALHLPPARRNISDEQFRKYFGDDKASAPLSTEALAHLRDTGGAPLKTLAEALLIVQASPAKDCPLLEETVTRAIEMANRRAREGFEVLTAQRALLHKLEAAKLDELRKDVAMHRAFKAIRADWVSAAEVAWKNDPRAQSTPYSGLLALTQADLEKAVRQLYDAIQENPARPVTLPTPEPLPPSETEQGKVKELKQDPANPEEREKPQPQTPPQPAPKPSPTANGQEGDAKAVTSRVTVDRRNEPDGVLLLTVAEGGKNLARFIDQSATELERLPFSAAKPKTAAEAIFMAMKPHLEGLAKAKASEWQKEHSGFGILKRRMPPKLKLHVVIESDEVRHRMSLLLREHIETFLKDWQTLNAKGIPGMELDWKVGLTFEPVAKQEGSRERP